MQRVGTMNDIQDHHVGAVVSIDDALVLKDDLPNHWVGIILNDGSAFREITESLRVLF